jgi:hypothetical protein
MNDNEDSKDEKGLIRRDALKIMGSFMKNAAGFQAPSGFCS